MRHVCLPKLVLIALVLALAPTSALYGEESAAKTDAAPDGWQPFAVRQEIAPRSWVERREIPPDREEYVLGLAGRGHEAVDGRWLRRVPVAPGNFYQFTAQYQARDVESPSRSVLARVIWLDAKGKQVEQAEYPASPAKNTANDWTPVNAIYRVPAAATQAQLELHLRWAADGTVKWQPATLTEVSPPEPRKVRLASVNHRPRQSKSPQDNLDQFAEQIERAAEQKADIVCLPEGITVVGTNKKYADVAETVPGPTTEFLGQHAARHKLYVVAGLYERDGKVIYNTSVLIGRDGELVGKYRKVCLPREEIDGGITPGKEYPVFDTDFGRVGMMICWDVQFPEVARELAAGGAEVLLMPIWGGNELLAKARAIENQVHVVASGYDFKTAIFDREGKTLAEADSDPSVIVAEIDLNDRVLWPWLGDLRSRIWREAPARSR